METKIRLTKTKRKARKKYVYTWRNYTVKYTNPYGGWQIYLRNDKFITNEDSLESVIKYFKGILDAEKLNKEVLREGGWVCPNGCMIETINVYSSETVYTTEHYSVRDQELEECLDREAEDSDNYERHEFLCPECKSPVGWREPENSIQFLKEMGDEDKS